MDGDNEGIRVYYAKFIIYKAIEFFAILLFPGVIEIMTFGYLPGFTITAFAVFLAAPEGKHVQTAVVNLAWWMLLGNWAKSVHYFYVLYGWGQEFHQLIESFDRIFSLEE